MIEGEKTCSPRFRIESVLHCALNIKIVKLVRMPRLHHFNRGHKDSEVCCSRAMRPIPGNLTRTDQNAAEEENYQGQPIRGLKRRRGAG